jgi:hypothetical protein
LIFCAAFLSADGITASPIMKPGEEVGGRNQTLPMTGEVVQGFGQTTAFGRHFEVVAVYM